ncbi:MAG: hypothetical protein JNL05_05465, partial [Flavobacteriales bacterium]|nr:hypothetical protein [Flavobacteriales bacterium]
APMETQQQGQFVPDEDYYSVDTASNYNLDTYQNERSYNDITYNDPAWYNQGRFGFGVGISSWGPSYGMGMSYGYPGYYNDPFYNPYWGNSWISGYGMWGYPYNGWNMGMGMGMGWGYPGYGYNPYWGYPGYGCAPCYGCGGGNYYPTTYAHRPGFGGSGSGGSTTTQVPVRYRPNTLLGSRPTTGTNPTMQRSSANGQRDQRNVQRSTGTRTEGSRSGGGQQRATSPGGSRSGGSRSVGGGGGGSTGGGGGSRPSTGGGRR